jgi:alanine racemase
VSLSLYVDGDRWRSHLRGVIEAHPELVPVLKGNGYGFGLARLARKAGWLGVDRVAVGTYPEVDEVITRFDGTILVLTPWRSNEQVRYDDRIVHTVGRLDDLRALAAQDGRPRILLERMTSMRRHGFSAHDLREAGALVSARGSGVRIEGIALHLPMAQGTHAAEMERLMTDVVAAGLPTRRVYVSHLTAAELGQVRAAYPDYEIHPRVGTDLWLGDRGALSARATVLDAHPVDRGDLFGYRGRSAPTAGTILVVSGGTAHGVGLEAPTAGTTLRQRAISVAKGGLDAAGFVRSPYTVAGKQRLFAEPPHMQASMLFLPQAVRPPAVGDEVDVRVRFTTTWFDRTVIC